MTSPGPPGPSGRAREGRSGAGPVPVVGATARPPFSGRAVTLAAGLQADLADGVGGLSLRELDGGAGELVDQPLAAESLAAGQVLLGRVQRLLLGRGGPGGCGRGVVAGAAGAGLDADGLVVGMVIELTR
jgi:hypothetical protein